MPIEVYVFFNGNCREAVEFYAEVFGTEKPKIMTYGEMPNPDPGLSEEAGSRVLHTLMNISGSSVMFSDFPPGMPYTAGNNFSLVIVSPDVEEIKTLFNRLKEGGSVSMELQETFWSKCYGMLTDRFGIGWQFSHYLGGTGE
ncbi:MAG: VOC family protein [Firmicutes bacterium]|nr:VOC family protein [Bacillota bacterium]